jgi:hypothetical protein
MRLRSEGTLRAGTHVDHGLQRIGCACDDRRGRNERRDDRNGAVDR